MHWWKRSRWRPRFIHVRISDIEKAQAAPLSILGYAGHGRRDDRFNRRVLLGEEEEKLRICRGSLTRRCLLGAGLSDCWADLGKRRQADRIQMREKGVGAVGDSEGGGRREGEGEGKGGVDQRERSELAAQGRVD